MSEDISRKERLEEARKILKEYLSKEGLRWTRQREIVLEAFIAADAHISVDELFGEIRQSYPELGHATVYRCMNLFSRLGIAKERHFNEGRVRFEPNVDVEHHDHIICTKCGAIREFEDPRIERLQDEIADNLGFDVKFHRLELYGLCPKCR
jgi:Fur family ferric uptake transcriptional regulator